MPSNNITGNDLLQLLKSRFPTIKMGNAEGMTTVDPSEAVFFDFDFIINSEKIASVSISIADDSTVKLFYSKDILTDQDEIVKNKWFDFLKDLRLFAKKRLMSFEPSDITKKKLDKRDYEQMSAETKTEEAQMTESALYGSTKSSYQKLENARLIIRHSQKVNEESANSRTRNIDSIYVENAQGERFRYPFNHLSGARAMMRHLANGGNPYDSFGQYIVGLSENVYNLRKFNNLMHRNAFLENAELTDIASAAKEKTISIKKVIERLQKQSGYEAIKENFTEYKRTELDADTLEALKNRFTIQNFNEELVDLFPYISDLINEDGLEEVSAGLAQRAAHHAFVKSDKMKKDAQKEPDMHSYVQAVHKGEKKSKQGTKFAKYAAKKMEEEHIEEGQVTGPRSYKGSPDRKRKAVQMALGRKHKDHPDWNPRTNPQYSALKLGRKLQKQGVTEEEHIEEGGLGEIGRMLGGKIGEAPKKTIVPKKAAPANVKSTDEPTAADAAAEPIGKVPFLGRAGDDVGDLQHAIKGMGEIRVEPFDKNSIMKAMDKTQAQIRELEGNVADNPRDKKMQYALEKAQARLGLLQARLGTADTQTGNPVTKIGLFIDHLSKHVKDDKLSLILSRVADGYNEMSKQERQEVNALISAMLKKAKYVPMFSAESTTYEELESMLGTTTHKEKVQGENLDPVKEYEQLLSKTIDEQSDILSTDLDVRNRAIGELNQLISDEFPVGTNGVNAIESLRGIIDDRNLFNQFMEMSQEDAGADARQQIVAWVQENAPDVMSELQVKGVKMPKLNKAPEEDSEVEPEAKEVDKPINEVEDFVKSLYDRHTGNFPRGETGVLTSVAKKFGDDAVPVAQSVIEGLKQSFDENIMRMRKLAGVS